jgi:hypothetical protein
VPTDRGFPAPAEGYVVSFTTFYERGFGMLPHLFLCSLMRCYVLKLHHLTPSGVLHTAAFVIVIPRSEIAEMKPPYVCPGCFIHTYSNNMINRCHVQ